jgi:hypothetical protein
MRQQLLSRFTRVRLSRPQSNFPTVNELSKLGGMKAFELDAIRNFGTNHTIVRTVLELACFYLFNIF